eukprot:GHVN01076396.1.p1 GENE.GHVN01076396.1~~GHVN01076396.1.p1  ORF type:complete len:302 (-),score=86.10 GHVN01076396.1:414-1319(-)
MSSKLASLFKAKETKKSAKLNLTAPTADEPTEVQAQKEAEEEQKKKIEQSEWGVDEPAALTDEQEQADTIARQEADRMSVQSKKAPMGWGGKGQNQSRSGDGEGEVETKDNLEDAKEEEGGETAEVIKSTKVSVPVEEPPAPVMPQTAKFRPSALRAGGGIGSRSSAPSKAEDFPQLGVAPTKQEAAKAKQPAKPVNAWNVPPRPVKEEKKENERPLPTTDKSAQQETEDSAVTSKDADEAHGESDEMPVSGGELMDYETLMRSVVELGALYTGDVSVQLDKEKTTAKYVGLPLPSTITAE